jgi:hypothetical protein
MDQDDPPLKDDILVIPPDTTDDRKSPTATTVAWTHHGRIRSCDSTTVVSSKMLVPNYTVSRSSGSLLFWESLSAYESMWLRLSFSTQLCL